MNEGYQFMLMGWPFFTKDIGLNDRRKLGMKVEKRKRLEAGEHVRRERHGGNCLFEEGDGTACFRVLGFWLFFLAEIFGCFFPF